MVTTIKDLFKESLDFLSQQHVFYGHGVEVAEDEVILLLMFVLQEDYLTLNAKPEQVVSDEQVDHVRNILQKRVEERIPMAYLVGFSVFAGLQFKVNDRVLIPRSPFAELIDLGFQPWLALEEPVAVLDLCTGSGCIGLAIAHYFKSTQVDVSDISREALALAQMNAQELSLNKRVTVIESDLFENITRCYDLLVSNPPYVDEKEYEGLPQEFAYEPKSALVSNKLGMEIPVKILCESPDYLSEKGFLFLEVGYNDEVLEGLFPDIPFEWIDLSMGGQGICVFSRDDLLKYRSQFKQFLQNDVS